MPHSSNTIGISPVTVIRPFELNALILLGIGLLLGVSGTALTLRRFLQV